MKIFDIPNGPKNLAPLFPSVDFTDIQKYYVEVADYCGTTIIATGTICVVDRKYHEDKIRLHFLNYAGKMDAINFKMYEGDHEAKSSIVQRRVKAPLDKKEHAINRVNVKANDTYTLACVDYGESDMQWLCELVDSPFALIEWTGIQGQDDSYIPVVIQDTSIKLKKLEERYIYEVIIQVQLSHDRFIIR